MSNLKKLNGLIVVKTEEGQRAIQSRSRDLSPLVRRILVLVDGKRSHLDLAAFLTEGADIVGILRELVDQGLVQAQVITSTDPSEPKDSEHSAPEDAPSEETARDESMQGFGVLGAHWIR